MPPLLIICFTAMACSLVRDDDKDMVRDDTKDMVMAWNDEVYQELTRAIKKELKLIMENTEIDQMPEKGTFNWLIFKAIIYCFKDKKFAYLLFQNEIISYFKLECPIFREVLGNES